MRKETIEKTIIIKNPFQAQRQVSFFLRLHRHLPDNICGGHPLGKCEYREDGKPINEMNDYVEKLQRNPNFRKKEKEVEEAVKQGKAIRIKK